MEGMDAAAGSGTLRGEGRRDRMYDIGRERGSERG